jgi:hypothetical protein
MFLITNNNEEQHLHQSRTTHRVYSSTQTAGTVEDNTKIGITGTRSRSFGRKQQTAHHTSEGQEENTRNFDGNV